MTGIKKLCHAKESGDGVRTLPVNELHTRLIYRKYLMRTNGYFWPVCDHRRRGANRHEAAVLAIRLTGFGHWPWQGRAN